MAYRQIDTGIHVAVGVLVGALFGVVGGVLLWAFPVSVFHSELPMLAYAVCGALAGVFVGALLGLIVALTRP